MNTDSSGVSKPRSACVILYQDDHRRVSWASTTNCSSTTREDVSAENMRWLSHDVAGRRRYDCR
jgi:hypothetical protein